MTMGDLTGTEVESKFTPNMNPSGTKNHVELRIWQCKDDVPEPVPTKLFPDQHWHWVISVSNGSFTYTLDGGVEATPEQASSKGVQDLKVFIERLNKEES
jgi:hypothetical protein